MASNFAKARDDISRKRDIRRLCTLFRGRFNEEVAAELIEEKGGLENAASFLMLGDEDEVRQRLNENEDYVISLQKDSAKFTLVLSQEKIDCQFACEDCKKMWWKRVPANKAVSKCFSCHRKFDPIPEEHQWGCGEFTCEHCNKTFWGFGIMGRTESRCYTCGNSAAMTKVHPPKKRERNQKPKTHKHNCNGVNCYGSDFYCQTGVNYHSEGFSIPRYHKVRAGVGEDKPPVCIHPWSAEPNERTRIHWASILHNSTGSTVDTFLDQGSLKTRSSSLALSLDTIPEEN